MWPLRFSLPLPTDDPPLKYQRLLNFVNNSEALFDVNYWRTLCPNLHCDDEAYKASLPKAFKPAPELYGSLQQCVTEQGFFFLPSREISWGVPFQQLAEAVVTLMQYGYPPTFIAMYDEVWALLHQVSELIEAISHTKTNLDFVTFYVNPNLDQAGFPPHRDRCMDNPEDSFLEDGSPKYSTVWIPLTDACTDNSCLCVIPKNHDPGYLKNECRFLDPYALQHIKALPCEAGSVIWFTHRLVHWGTEGYHTPRIAIACGYATEDFEAPYFDLNTQLPFPDFSLRVSFAGGQALLYSCRFRYTLDELELWKSLFSKNKELFHEDYVNQTERSACKKIKKHQAKIADAATDTRENLTVDFEEEEKLRPYPENTLLEEQVPKPPPELTLKGEWGLYKDSVTEMLFWLHKKSNITGWYPPYGWMPSEHSKNFDLANVPVLLERHQQMQAEWWQKQQLIAQKEARDGVLGVDISWKM